MKVAVAGDGIVGFAAARILQDAAGDGEWDITVFGDGAGDGGKSLVVSKGVADALESLSALPANTRAISKARITFGGGGAAGESLSDFTLSDDDAFYFAIDRDAVLQSLRSGVSHRRARIAAIASADDGVTLTAEDAEEFTAGLLLITCPLPRLPAPFYARRHDYHQTILSMTASVDQWQTNSARQKFFARGIAVLVPRTDGAVGVVLCLAAPTANAYNAMDDSQLSKSISDLFGMTIRISGKRHAYCAELRRVNPLAAGRVALIGQGATTLHPVGAQAMRLAFDDIRRLTQCLAQSVAIPAALRQYSRAQTSEHRKLALATTALAVAAPPLSLFGAVGNLLPPLLTHARNAL